jgi:hypothetical protein
MLYLNGLKENLETLLVLAKSTSPETEIKTIAEIKKGLRKYLLHFQEKAIVTDVDEQEIVEIKNNQQIKIFRELFSEKSQLNDLKQESLIDPKIGWNYEELNSDKFKEAINFFRVEDPGVYQFLNLIFNYYFFANSGKAAGGSSSGGIGVLWVNPNKNWLMQDYAEFIIHEMTHQILFYDERRFEHYPDYASITNKENYAYSTILNRGRPLDKVVHSLLVGINVLLFREKFFGLNSKPTLHPESHKIIESLEKTFESIDRLKPELMSLRLHNLINNAKNSTILIKERFKV